MHNFCKKGYNYQILDFFRVSNDPPPPRPEKAASGARSNCRHFVGNHDNDKEGRKTSSLHSMNC